MGSLVVIFGLFYIVFSEDVADFEVDKEWEKYKKEYGLDFQAPEEDERKKIFLGNLNYIHEFNRKNKSFQLGMNMFGHLRASEVVSLFDLKEHEKVSGRSKIPKIGKPLPTWMNWLSYGMVTPVHNQKECNASYAFSGVGAIESHYAIRTGVLEDLSAQEVVDCPSSTFAGGCNSGRPENTFQYAVEHGLSLKGDYPYTGVSGSCKNGSKLHRRFLQTYVKIPSGDEQEIIRVLAEIGPVSVAVDANHPDFLFYRSGIIDLLHCKKNKPSLMALVVGYDMQSSTPFFHVKNSWGSRWGELGYFAITLNKNMCGIASYASYPIIKE